MIVMLRPRLTDRVARLAYGTIANPRQSIDDLLREGLVTKDPTHGGFRCTLAGIAELEAQP